MLKNKYILTFIAIGFFALYHAQEVRPISKSEVQSIVSENNQKIKISTEAFNEAKADYRQTNAVFLPNISVAHTAIATTNPLMAFGSKLNQEIVTQADFNPDVLNDPSQIQNFATIFEFQQPLINADGFYQRKAARYKMQAMALQTDRVKDFVNFEVENAYMQLQLAYKAVAVLEKSLEAGLANLKLANDSFNQGYLQRADVLLVEVRVTEIKNQLQTARSNVKNASNYLSFLMNDESDVVFQPIDSLVMSDILLETPAMVVTENRADIKAMQLATNAMETLYKSDKMTFLPTLNAFGSYQLYDENLFQFGADGYLIGAELKWNILQGTKRFGKAKKAKASYEKSKLEYEQYVSQSKLELNKTKRLLEDAKSKTQLSQLAVEQSREALRIRTNRFREGLEKTADLLLAETQFAKKQLEYYQTIYEYNSTKAYLNFLMIN
ncbi:TolC family protein [Winogradskyella alexanderae]|uniref:TolC family protein n=1 Tax=Winogradskyella alexanderae TaxID=2877123 RepID=A0ABS7XNU9_9FLAO|nr:TolC family protein [Winogradskyella alexanderae]MCA0131687.1 TolC family protein [Winogradskyella alexanderae]